MGLFVVSRLALRHGLTVQLDHNDRMGITATVFLPTSVLSDTARLEAGSGGAQVIELGATQAVDADGYDEYAEVRRQRRAGGRRRGRLPSPRAGARAGPRLRPDHRRDQRLRPAAASPRRLGCRQRHRAGVDGWRLLRPSRLRGDGHRRGRESRSRTTSSTPSWSRPTRSRRSTRPRRRCARRSRSVRSPRTSPPTRCADEDDRRGGRRGRRDEASPTGRPSGRGVDARPTSRRTTRGRRDEADVETDEVDRGRRARGGRRGRGAPGAGGRGRRRTTTSDEVASRRSLPTSLPDEDHLAPVLAGLALAPSVPFDAQEATAGLTRQRQRATATRTATATVTREGWQPGCTASPPPPRNGNGMTTARRGGSGAGARPGRRRHGRPHACRTVPAAWPARPRPWTRTRPRSSGRCAPTG